VTGEVLRNDVEFTEAHGVEISGCRNGASKANERLMRSQTCRGVDV